MTPNRFPVRRAGERGAAVFVVVMAITLLTAIGLFAAHSATLVDQAAGYTRLARQTQYLAEYGTLVAAAELGAGAADEYVAKLATGNDACSANQGAVGAPCYKLFSNELQARSVAGGGAKLIETTAVDGTPGSFGKTAQTFGEFAVQLTDPGPIGRPIAGTDVGGQDGFGYIKVTATTTAQIRSSPEACSDDVTTTIGQQSLRAHLLIGPLSN